MSDPLIYSIGIFSYLNSQIKKYEKVHKAKPKVLLVSIEYYNRFLAGCKHFNITEISQYKGIPIYKQMESLIL